MQDSIYYRMPINLIGEQEKHSSSCSGIMPSSTQFLDVLPFERLDLTRQFNENARQKEEKSKTVLDSFELLERRLIEECLQKLG